MKYKVIYIEKCEIDYNSIENHMWIKYKVEIKIGNW